VTRQSEQITILNTTVANLHSHIRELEVELAALRSLVQKKAAWEARLTDAEHALIWEA
jgi:hypothetical protein